MLQATWRNASFRFWIGVGMSVTVLPLVVSALLHTLVVRSAIGDFQNVAGRQRDQLIPLQQLQTSLRSTAGPIDTFLLGSDPAQPLAYRRLREQIESGFARLDDPLKTDVNVRALVDRARADWTVADQNASRMFEGPPSATARELGEQARTSVAAAVDQLDAAARGLSTRIDRDYLEARRSSERADLLASVAAVMSAFSIMGGIAIVGYVLSRSMDRLVEGAARVAAGEREHRIDVYAPVELHRMADAFNHLVVQLRESHAALADLARHDCLTGLLNRRALDELLVDALARHERVSEGVAVIMIDVDFFKGINDRHGHFAGDEVLRLVSTRLTESIREIDRAFRFGGEEFAVLLFNSDRESAEVAAERVRLAVAARPMSVNGVDITVTISAGIATTDDSANAEGLLNAADAALYCAKSTGRNRVVWVGAMA